MEIKQSDLTLGVLDGAALRAFKQGASGALAIAIHDSNHWPIYAVTDSHNVTNGCAGNGPVLHWVVRRPDGLFIDVNGAHTEEELVEEYNSLSAHGQCAIGISHRVNCWDSYGDAQGGPITIFFATSFINVVLEKAATREVEGVPLRKLLEGAEPPEFNRQLSEQLIEAAANFYLEYVNNWLTPARYAEANGMDLEFCEKMLRYGRKCHEERAAAAKAEAVKAAQ